jgi:molecular chaperone GrpE (heat shock protein)
VVEEYRKGYMFKDRLLRAAKVVVSKSSGSGD